MAMQEAEYLETRVDDQITWFEAKAAANQKAYKRLRLIEIVAAASIPLLAGQVTKVDYLDVAVGALGMIVAIIAGLLSLYRFQENWTEYRATAEGLKQERFLYMAKAGPYDGEGDYPLFVERVEGLLSSEVGGWRQSMKKAASAERKKQAGKLVKDAIKSFKDRSD